jgi:hypothetical protein
MQKAYAVGITSGTGNGVGRGRVFIAERPAVKVTPKQIVTEDPAAPESFDEWRAFSGGSHHRREEGLVHLSARAAIDTFVVMQTRRVNELKAKLEWEQEVLQKAVELQETIPKDNPGAA